MRQAEIIYLTSIDNLSKRLMKFLKYSMKNLNDSVVIIKHTWKYISKDFGRYNVNSLMLP
jgi:hypothetical protein